MKMFPLVDAKTIERAGADVHLAGKIAAFLGFERMKRALCIFLSAFFQDKIDILLFRRPNPKVRLVWRD